MIFILSKEAVEKKLNIYKNFDEIVLKKCGCVLII